MECIGAVHISSLRPTSPAVLAWRDGLGGDVLAVVACVSKAVASATFHASNGKTNVQFPFVFWHETPGRAD